MRNTTLLRIATVAADPARLRQTLGGRSGGPVAVASYTITREYVMPS